MKPMTDVRTETFLADVLALEGESPDAIREGVNVALVDCEQIFKAQEVNKRMKDKAAHACHVQCRARIIEEMQRYFDMGVLHAQLPELIQHLGAAEGEGTRFVVSELRYMGAVAPWLVPEVVVRNAAKYLGYRLGRMFRRLPNGMRRVLSMTKGYWDSVPLAHP